MSRYALAATLAIGVFVSIQGCRAKPGGPPKANLAQPPQFVRADAPSEPATSSQLLARQAQTYAKEIEQAPARVLVSKPVASPQSEVVGEGQRANTPAKVGAQPDVVSSAVQPKQSSAEDAVAAQGTTVAPSNADTQQQVVTLAKAVEGLHDEPMIVPEGMEVSSAPTTMPTRAAVPDDLGRRLARRVVESPRDVAAHLDHQLHLFIAGAAVPDLTSLTTLPKEDREVVAAVIDGLSNFRSGVQSEPTALLSKRVKPLVQTGERLKAHAGLMIPTVQLCRAVKGFGDYEMIEPARFPPGGDGRMLIYTEVRNFSSERQGTNLWETRLLHSTVLYEENGRRVSEGKQTPVVDKCQSQRSDFFVTGFYQLPPTLPAGRYILKVRIRDQNTNQVAECPVTVEVSSVR